MTGSPPTSSSNLRWSTSFRSAEYLEPDLFLGALPQACIRRRDTSSLEEHHTEASSSSGLPPEEPFLTKIQTRNTSQLQRALHLFTAVDGTSAQALLSSSVAEPHSLAPASLSLRSSTSSHGSLTQLQLLELIHLSEQRTQEAYRTDDARDSSAWRRVMLDAAQTLPCAPHLDINALRESAGLPPLNTLSHPHQPAARSEAEFAEVIREADALWDPSRIATHSRPHSHELDRAALEPGRSPMFAPHLYSCTPFHPFLPSGDLWTSSALPLSFPDPRRAAFRRNVDADQSLPLTTSTGSVPPQPQPQARQPRHQHQTQHQPWQPQHTSQVPSESRSSSPMPAPGSERERERSSLRSANRRQIYYGNTRNAPAKREHTTHSSSSSSTSTGGDAPRSSRFRSRSRHRSEETCSESHERWDVSTSSSTSSSSNQRGHRAVVPSSATAAPVPPVETAFLSAREKLYLDNDQVPPPRQKRSQSQGQSGGALGAQAARKRQRNQNQNERSAGDDVGEKHPLLEDERLKHMDSAMVERILSEVLDHNPIGWDDIAGLRFAKVSVQEMVILPMKRPDIFTGLRAPPKGLLLFGPPGTGKTLIGKAIAGESNATFFSISASSLTSKWVGEGEKMVRCLFAVARCFPSSVIFIDEIDSLLSSRSDQEIESSRRIKTQFLVEMDGAGVAAQERLLVIGATNRPQELDEAFRRRMLKRLYIPLPNAEARLQLITHLLRSQAHSLNEEELTDIVQKTKGYSGSDLKGLLGEAALGPIRELGFAALESVAVSEVPAISHGHFISALKQVRASVNPDELHLYEEWNAQFGSFGEALDADID